MIPTMDLTQRELVKRLKELVDYVADPDSRIQDPQKFAEAYARLVNLATLYPDKFGTKYVQHNLGIKRIAYIRELLGERHEPR